MGDDLVWICIVRKIESLKLKNACGIWSGQNDEKRGEGASL
jgi:hypothetical protein